MSDYFEELCEKAVKEAVEKAQERTVLNLIKLGKLSLEEIAKCSGLTLERVQMLANTL